jgi:hypothetical protein
VIEKDNAGHPIRQLQCAYQSELPRSGRFLWSLRARVGATCASRAGSLRKGLLKASRNSRNPR